IISYTEYVFLLCILTKPQGGFKIAFNMFDRDGNQKVDRQEFLVIEEIFGKKTDTDPSKSVSLVSKYLGRDRDTFKPQSLEGPPKTTLMVHLFGHKGRDTLDFQTFYRFMDDLQVEVLELEFMEFSKGMNTISEEEFAEVLLKYTRAVDTEREDYIERLKTRIQQDK
uniref:Calcium uptake protein 3, mitochondrial-like n=1 Tax=Saccoglossus kowalevskii TaxID=10224 RepID=A0ABM0MNG0_SACKO